MPPADSDICISASRINRLMKMLWPSRFETALTAPPQHEDFNTTKPLDLP